MNRCNTIMITHHERTINVRGLDDLIIPNFKCKHGMHAVYNKITQKWRIVKFGTPEFDNRVYSHCNCHVPCSPTKEIPEPEFNDYLTKHADDITCPCGSTTFDSIRISDNKFFTMQCVACGDVHVIKLPSHLFTTKKKMEDDDEEDDKDDDEDKDDIKDEDDEIDDLKQGKEYYRRRALAAETTVATLKSEIATLNLRIKELIREKQASSET
jgi:hypothetical protein